MPGERSCSSRLLLHCGLIDHLQSRAILWLAALIGEVLDVGKEVAPVDHEDRSRELLPLRKPHTITSAERLKACASLLDAALFISHLLSNRLKSALARSPCQEERSQTCNEATPSAWAMSQRFLCLPVVCHLLLSFLVTFQHQPLIDVDVRDHRLAPLRAS